jgi:hypothetical protein
MVASVLPFCASSCLAADSAHAASRARGQTASATLPAAYPSHGSRQNHPRLDGARGALLPIAKGFRLRGIEARWGAVSCRGEMGEGTRRRARKEPHSGKRRPVWTAASQKTGPKCVRRGLVDLSTMSHGSTFDRNKLDEPSSNVAQPSGGLIPSCVPSDIIMGNNEGGEEDLHWERESHEPQLTIH